MNPVVSIGNQDFESIRTGNCFYVDKTSFNKEWWESKDIVTLITRPRRFGKTLNLSMVDTFFSNQHAGKGHLFEGLSIWQEEKYQKLQGTYPVLFLSFSGIKGKNFKDARMGIILLDEYDTPLQEAYLGGYWDEMSAFIRSLFNAAFKTNPSMERGILTGITRVSKESIFSDLNNLQVVTTTSRQYATAFGFTEQEVETALDFFGARNAMDKVKFCS